MNNGVSNDADILGLKTKRAWTDKREPFSPNDINDSEKLLRMRASSGLWDDDLNELIIVPQGQSNSTRKPARAHFKLKSGEPRTPIHRDSADPTHNDAVDELQRRLATEGASLHIVSKARDANRKHIRKRLWTQHSLSDYTWHKEPSTRLLMECGDFIQPDIVGVDTKRMNRTTHNPTIIIEVVHHHWPEKATFSHLKTLSKLNHIVVFYFVKKGLKENSFANALKLNGNINTLTAASFLVGGNFMHEGEVVEESINSDVDYFRFNELAEAAAEKSFTEQAAIAKAEAEARGNVK
ncbi:hypothetical protein NJG16_01275 [Stenotrophomonas maltophilia]|uniref:hypothetical protein n=1 Tax=Stenotrophomonas lactitubi TaxID=2045214 RepID=UPI0020411AFE|nr:hypothetical protein [Stenotrophomonas lactitubi]MCO7468697.1 hypothetical protein [Stenotrophomonas maltophilia]